MFDQDDESRGFWDDEPTRPLERLAARLKPAGSPPPAPTRPWPSRANQPHTPQRAPLVDKHMFDDLDHDLDQDWSPAPPTYAAERPVPQRDNWPASVGEAVMMVARKGRAQGRSVAANIDPLIRRVGTVVLIVLLCIPVALALRGGDAHGESIAPDTSTLAVGTAAPSSTDAPQAAPAALAQALPATPLVCDKSYTVAKGDYWVLIAAKTNTTLKSVLAANRATKTTLLLPGRTVCLAADATWPTVAAEPATAAPATTTASKVAKAASCTKKYTIVSGDSWSMIAKHMSITTTQLLAANQATTRSVLLPGRSICLPTNAVVPAPPKPAVTTTTVKAVVRPPASARGYTRAEVTQMIRDVFPDDLEEHALVIAERESHLNPYSANFCCYGVFQINYNAHSKWLPSIGVTSAAQLFDPLVNTRAALIIYQRSNSWAPWGG